MHNFVYLAQRRSQEFSCEPNFGEGRALRPLPLGCASAANAPAAAAAVDQPDRLTDGRTLDRFMSLAA